MPKLSKYKAAGRTAGSYQRSIGDVNKLGLGLQHAQWKGEEQRSLYGAIGGSVANIIGIIKEKKMLGELNKLKESAGGLPGIVKESEEYQPMGKFGEILGLDKKRKDVFKSRFTGEEISDTMLYGIGKSEALRQGSTMYGDVQAISDKLASGEGYNPVRDKAFAQVGATSQEEYDKLTDVDLFDTEEEQSPITEPKAIKYVPPEKPRKPSINDNVVSSIVEDNGKSMFMEDSVSIKSGLSKFESNIAMSENRKLYDSMSSSDSLFKDKYKSTGTDRRAYGFGTLYTGKEDTSFGGSISSMRKQISVVESSLKKSIGEDMWVSMPKGVRESVTEMGYIMGNSKLYNKFPKMMKALKAGNYKEAGKQAEWQIYGTRKAAWIGDVNKDRSYRILSGFYDDSTTNLNNQSYNWDWRK